MSIDQGNNSRLQQWIALLQAKGHVASKRRILIMQALYQKKKIEDMEFFWLELRQEHHISWATFYSFVRLALKEQWLRKSFDQENTVTYLLHIEG